MSTLGECTCGCHLNPNIKHVMACCYICPHCGRNIMTHVFDIHKKECEKREDETDEERLIRIYHI